MTRHIPARRVPLLAACFVFSACAAGDADGGPGDRVVVRDSAGVSVVESGDPAGAPLWTLASEPDVSVGSLDAGGPEQLYRVAGAVALGDGGVAVLNAGSGEVRVFGPAGDFVRAVGGKGEGPGEFAGAAGLWTLPGDSLLVWDRRLRRTTVFDPGGEFARVATLEGGLLNPDVFAVFRDGSLLVSQLMLSVPESGYAPVPIVLTRHGPEGPRRDSLGQVVFTEMGPWDLGGGATRVSARLFAPRASVAGDEGGYWVGTGRASELRRHAPDGRLVVRARWEGRDREVTDADARAELESTLARTPEERREATRRVWGNRDVAARFPAHGALFPGGEGSVLVSPYERPRDEGGRPWLVVAPDGRLRARLRLPDRFRPTELGEGWLLGIETDEMDVEYVRRYEIIKGGGS